jgi:undecaprenyl-diphosphatase
MEGARLSQEASRERARGSWLAFALRWGSWAVVGVALSLVASFVELSEELLDPEEQATRLVGADAAVLRFVARARTPWLNGIAMDLTALGSTLLVAIFTVSLGAILFVKGDRRGATILVVSAFASGALTIVTKRLLERPRPEIVPRLVEVSGLSYPSGHSLASAAVYLTAAFIIARHVSLVRERVAGVVFTSALVLSIGVSRVYLGVHYPSDVFGGILLGTAWALVMGVVVRGLDRTARGAASSKAT